MWKIVVLYNILASVLEAVEIVIPTTGFLK